MPLRKRVAVRGCLSAATYSAGRNAVDVRAATVVSYRRRLARLSQSQSPAHRLGARRRAGRHRRGEAHVGAGEHLGMAHNPSVAGSVPASPAPAGCRVHSRRRDDFRGSGRPGSRRVVIGHARCDSDPRTGTRACSSSPGRSRVDAALCARSSSEAGGGQTGRSPLSGKHQ